MLFFSVVEAFMIATLAFLQRFASSIKLIGVPPYKIKFHDTHCLEYHK